MVSVLVVFCCHVCSRDVGSGWGRKLDINQALTTQLVRCILDYCEDKVNEENDSQGIIRWTKAGALFAISYILSLWGNEGIPVNADE